MNPPGVEYKPIIMILGPSGSCKTTSVKQICDMLEFDVWDTKMFDRKVRGQIFKDLVSPSEQGITGDEDYAWSSEFERTTYMKVWLTMLEESIDQGPGAHDAVCIFEEMPNRAPKTLAHIREFWRTRRTVMELKLNLKYKNYLPIPMIFCLNNNTMAEMIVRKQLFPPNFKNNLVFTKTVKTGKKMIAKLFQTLERNLCSKSEYNKFKKKCLKTMPFGKTKYPFISSIPNLHRFFKIYAMLSKKLKKEMREELYHCTQGDVNLILNECYQKGIRMGNNIDEYQKKLKDATKNIFQRVGRVIYCKKEGDDREPLYDMIKSQSGERIDQTKFRQ